MKHRLANSLLLIDYKITPNPKQNVEGLGVVKKGDKYECLDFENFGLFK